MSERRDRPEEAKVEFKLRFRVSRLALADANRKLLCTTRNAYFDHLLDLAPLARERHQTAEAVAALHFQLWEVQRMDREGHLDHDLAQAIITHIEHVARLITRPLRLSE